MTIGVSFLTKFLKFQQNDICLLKIDSVNHFPVVMEFFLDLIADHWKQRPKYMDLWYIQPSFYQQYVFTLECIHLI